MSAILVVDDMAIFRDAIAASLKGAGYETLSAANGKEALASARVRPPDLVLLDLAMPVMDGLSFLERLRGDARLRTTPVILLTAVSEKNQVLRAAKLGVQDYLLKSQFSLDELLERIKKRLGKTHIALTSHAREPHKTADAGVPNSTMQVPQLLARDACIRRAETAMHGRALSGVATEVVGIAASPRGDMSDLASLIAKDPILSARILRAANSAAYVSSRGPTTTIPEAVRQIGCAGVRNIAAALGVFDAMPVAEMPDGFNPIRCWQHSFAVAQLCERLVGMAEPENAGVAYLVGLCHDLGEILLHTHFGHELKQVQEMQKRTGKRRDELERAMLGMTHNDLTETILESIDLPDRIRKPILAFHHAGGARPSDVSSRITRALRVANLYANGMLLASDRSSRVAPALAAECRAACGQDAPPRPDVPMMRCEILGLTGLLARLSRDESDLMEPILPSHPDVRLWVAREPAFSDFCPLTAALDSLAAVDVYDRLPKPSEKDQYRGLVVITRNTSAGGWAGTEIASIAGDAPVLWLATRIEMPVQGPVQPLLCPATLFSLAEFVNQVSGQPAS